MKKLSLLAMLLVTIGASADNHLPENFSMYQSNFHFKCDEAEKCFAAFDKYMTSPEVVSQDFEVDIYSIQHNGWDDATHGVSWYFKDEDQYAKSGQVFVTSQAGRDFRKTLNDLGVEATQENLSVHTIGVIIKEGASSNGVNLRWSLEVSNPAKFLPLWKNFSQSIEKYEWSANGYGLQTHYLGNNGKGITHEIWAGFDSPQAALKFLSGMNNSKEFAKYGPMADKYSIFKRSYMEVTLKMYNPD